ncbi:hypothetical protein [Metapseudomonas otitidis]|uniref:hypothetical protein n=1 Tax=Metapseudomonas otitidis TaxID=319939 RepID=UPI0026125387|nr:hypothetical protein [Pseudomonas otitidis]
MSNSNVVSLNKVRAELKADGAFLKLLEQDIAQNPECIEPLPSGLLDRMARIRAKAEENRRRTELLEG